MTTISSTRVFSKIQPYLLFLVWPFMALVMAIINYRSSYAKNIVWFFTIFFGFTFVISSDKIDANFYRNALENLYYYGTIPFPEYLQGLISGEIGRGDYYQPLLTYIVSRFTPDYRVLFALYGLVFGYFFSRNTWSLLSYSNKKISLYALPFIILFAFLVPIWTINGVRFWTAAHVFFFGVFHLYNSRKLKYIIIAFVSTFIHMSFVFPVLILLLHKVLGNRLWLYVGLFFVSTLFLRIDIGNLVMLISKFSPSSQSLSLLEEYTHPDYIELRLSRTEKEVWFLEWSRISMRVISFFIIIYLMVVRKKIKDKLILSLFSIGLLLFTITNIMSVIPSVGRFFTVSHLFLVAALFLYIQKTTHAYWLQRSSMALTFPIILFCVVRFRIGMEMLGVGLFSTNPLIAPFFENKYALTQILGL